MLVEILVCSASGVACLSFTYLLYSMRCKKSFQSEYNIIEPESVEMSEIGDPLENWNLKVHV